MFDVAIAHNLMFEKYNTLNYTPFSVIGNSRGLQSECSKGQDIAGRHQLINYSQFCEYID